MNDEEARERRSTTKRAGRVYSRMVLARDVVGPRAGGNNDVDTCVCEITPLLLVCPLPPFGARSALMATARPARAFAAVPALGRVARRVAPRAVRSDAAAIPRRDAIFGTAASAALASACFAPRPGLAADIGSVGLSKGGVGEPLRPLAEYRAALDAADAELAAIAADLRAEAGGPPRPDEAPREDDRAFDADSDAFLFDEPALAAPMSAPARRAVQARLHSGELGRFWITSRGTDRYMIGTRSPFARDEEDLWKLLPERSGPLGKLLQPDFDNPDDPLCLVYSCVNDPRAPPSIDVLYALKLLDEGLATDGVTAIGLEGNCEDAREKLRAYRELVERDADAKVTDEAWRNPAPGKGWGRVGV